MKQADDFSVKPVLTRHAFSVDSPFFSAPREIGALEVLEAGGVKKALGLEGFIYPIVAVR